MSVNSVQQLFHGKRRKFHGDRIARLKRFSAGSKRGAKRKRAAVRKLREAADGATG